MTLKHIEFDKVWKKANSVFFEMTHLNMLPFCVYRPKVFKIFLMFNRWKTISLLFSFFILDTKQPILDFLMLNNIQYYNKNKKTGDRIKKHDG